MRKTIAIGALVIAAATLAGCSGGAVSTLPSTAQPATQSANLPSTPTIVPTSSPVVVALTVQPTNVSLPTAAGISSETITVSEPNYTGAFTVSASACAGIAFVTPVNPNGPAATFVVSQIGAGSCTATFKDGQGNSRPLTVGSTMTSATIVIPAPKMIQAPISIALPTSANAITAPLAVTESDYTGTFTMNASACAGIVSVSPGVSNGAITTFTVSQIAAGMCVLTITDLHGQNVTVSVSSTTTIGIIGG